MDYPDQSRRVSASCDRAGDWVYPQGGEKIRPEKMSASTQKGRIRGFGQNHKHEELFRVARWMFVQVAAPICKCFELHFRSASESGRASRRFIQPELAGRDSSTRNTYPPASRVAHIDPVPVVFSPLCQALFAERCARRRCHRLFFRIATNRHLESHPPLEASRNPTTSELPARPQARKVRKARPSKPRTGSPRREFRAGHVSTTRTLIPEETPPSTSTFFGRQAPGPLTITRSHQPRSLPPGGPRKRGTAPSFLFLTPLTRERVTVSLDRAKIGTGF